MHAKLYIPKKMSLGLQQRAGTYTGKIGFLNPYNEKDKVKFGASWDNWRDKKIAPKDIVNTPTEGFIINRNAGGKSSGWYWDSGREAKIRVWDPRDFEIEITIPNMLYILEQANSYKGKGLEGEFVYGYNGSQLMLIPIGSEEYKGSVEFTDLKYQKVSSKELSEGASVFTKKQETLIYIGKYDILKPHAGWGSQTFSVGKELVFYNEKTKKFFPMKAAEIAKILDTEYPANYSALVETYEGLGYLFPNKKLELVDANNIKPAELYRYATKCAASQEITTEGMLFAPEGDIYKGYRVMQFNKEKMVTYGTGKNSYQHRDGWEVTGFKLVNPFNISFAGGVNKILPGKDEPRDITIREINKIPFVRVKAFVKNDGSSKYNKLYLG